MPAGISVDFDAGAPERLDWRWITDYAVRHGLAPLLHRRIGELNQNYSSFEMIRDRLPEADLPWGIERDLVRRLQRVHLSTMKRNSLIRTVLAELDHAVKGTGVVCILWKGAALINDVYPDISLRPMDDIDLLLPAVHRSRLFDVLKGLGFAPGSAYPMTWQGRGVSLDLHLDVVHGDRISGRLKALPLTAERMVEEARPLAGFDNILTLSPGDTLICSAVHALKHGFSRDVWLMDAAYLLNRHPAIVERFENLYQRSRRLGAEIPVYLLLSLLRTWRHRLNMDFVGRMRPANLGFLPRKFVQSFERGRQIPYAGELFYLFLLNSRKERLSFIFETMFPSRQVMRQLFPGRRSMPYWSYYPHRILRLAGMGLETFRALVRQRENEKQLL